jgi:hypothetical protein
MMLDELPWAPHYSSKELIVSSLFSVQADIIFIEYKMYVR